MADVEENSNEVAVVAQESGPSNQSQTLSQATSSELDLIGGPFAVIESDPGW